MKDLIKNNRLYDFLISGIWFIVIALCLAFGISFLSSCNTFKKLPCVNGTWVGHSDYYGDVTITRDCKGVYRIAREGSWLEVSKDSVNVWIDNGDKSFTHGN